MPRPRVYDTSKLSSEVIEAQPTFKLMFQKRARALLGKISILPRQGHTLSTLLTLLSLSRTEHTCILFYVYFFTSIFSFFLSFVPFWRTPRSGLRALLGSPLNIELKKKINKNVVEISMLRETEAETHTQEVSDSYVHHCVSTTPTQSQWTDTHTLINVGSTGPRLVQKIRCCLQARCCQCFLGMLT